MATKRKPKIVKAKPDDLTSEQVISDGERQGKETQEKAQEAQATDVKPTDPVLSTETPVTAVTSAPQPPVEPEPTVAVVPAGQIVAHRSIPRLPVDPTGKKVAPKTKPTKNVKVDQVERAGVPPISGQVTKQPKDRSTVRLRYSGESPVRAVQGPFPSGAKYRIWNGFVVVYVLDAQTLLDRGDFSQAD